MIGDIIYFSCKKNMNDVGRNGREMDIENNISPKQKCINKINP